MYFDPGEELKIYQHILYISKNISKYGYYIDRIEMWENSDGISIEVSVNTKDSDGDVYSLQATKKRHELADKIEYTEEYFFLYEGHYLEFVNLFNKTEEILSTLPEEDVDVIRKAINKDF